MARVVGIERRLEEIARRLVAMRGRVAKTTETVDPESLGGGPRRG